MGFLPQGLGFQTVERLHHRSSAGRRREGDEVSGRNQRTRAPQPHETAHDMLRIAAARAAPALRGAARAKSTTGIVGLHVQPDARAILTGLYTKTLSALEALPADSAYRSQVQETTAERLSIVKGNEDLMQIEVAIGAGQVEQVIQQAEDELALIPALAAEDVFAPYNGPQPSEIYVDLKRRGILLQRYDIPMRQSQDYPTADAVELLAPATEKEEGK